MENKFNKDGFLAYLRYMFPAVYQGDAGHYISETVSNMIDFAEINENDNKDQFCEFLELLLPEVEFGEIAAFMDNEGLTFTHGSPEKSLAMKAHNISVEYENGLCHVFVEGKELPL